MKLKNWDKFKIKENIFLNIFSNVVILGWIFMYWEDKEKVYN